MNGAEDAVWEGVVGLRNYSWHFREYSGIPLSSQLIGRVGDMGRSWRLRSIWLLDLDSGKA